MRTVYQEHILIKVNKFTVRRFRTMKTNSAAENTGPTMKRIKLTCGKEQNPQ